MAFISFGDIRGYGGPFSEQHSLGNTGRKFDDLVYSIPTTYDGSMNAMHAMN